MFGTKIGVFWPGGTRETQHLFLLISALVSTYTDLCLVRTAS